jgi:hypothetical protein
MAAAVANLTMFAATQATNPLFFVLTLVFVILIVESPLRMSYRRPIFHPSV